MLPVIGNAGENNQYVSYIFGNGVIRTGSQFPINIETGGTLPVCRTAWLSPTARCTTFLAPHGLPSKDHPTNADLATGANWGLAFKDHRNIHAVRLVTNVNGGGIAS